MHVVALRKLGARRPPGKPSAGTKSDGASAAPEAPRPTSIPRGLYGVTVTVMAADRPDPPSLSTTPMYAW
jgi:hypothetical protein